ncbi:MAG: hypothetical protein HY686_03170 [Chloroflexi bacterium]|nr:hypothetical protein [Chloroflexota bacterium]
MSAVLDVFGERLRDYVGKLDAGLGHDARRERFLGFLKDAFAVDLSAYQIEERVFTGPVDAILGALVFEFKRDLAQEGADAESQLKRYISDLRREHPGKAYTGIACDGLRVRAYTPLYEENEVTVREVRLVGELDLAPAARNPKATENAFSGWTLSWPTSGGSACPRQPRASWQASDRPAQPSASPLHTWHGSSRRAAMILRSN